MSTDTVLLIATFILLVLHVAGRSWVVQVGQVRPVALNPADAT